MGKLYHSKYHILKKKEDFIVKWDASTKEISCLCRSFEFNGFLCRHALCTLHSLGVFSISSCYILKRWIKDVRTKFKKDSMCEDLQSKKQRHDDLLERAIKLIEEGSLSMESYNIAQGAMKDALKHCSTVNQSLKLSNNNACAADESYYLDKENFDGNILSGKRIVLDPQVSKIFTLKVNLIDFFIVTC